MIITIEAEQADQGREEEGPGKMLGPETVQTMLCAYVRIWHDESHCYVQL